MAGNHSFIHKWHHPNYYSLINKEWYQTSFRICQYLLSVVLTPLKASKINSHWLSWCIFIISKVYTFKQKCGCCCLLILACLLFYFLCFCRKIFVFLLRGLLTDYCRAFWLRLAALKITVATKTCKQGTKSKSSSESQIGSIGADTALRKINSWTWALTSKLLFLCLV